MDHELAKECLQVVSAIRCEIISRSISCNLGAILDLLRQALRLAEAGQATGETLAESGEFESQAMPPASGGLSVDSPPGLPLADESMDFAGCPTGSSSPVGQPEADLDESDAGERESTPPVLPPLRRPPPSPTSTPVRTSRGTGGSQRSYVVRQHFIHGQSTPRGICSLEHVPKKKPDALVRYGTHEDTAETVALIADVLHTKQCLKASKSELLQALLQVADVTTTCCPEDDNSRPSGCGEQALDDWDCAAAVRHIQSLLLLPKSLEVLSNYQIGQYLKYLATGGGHDAVNALIAHLCSQAASTEVQQYQSLLTHCGCSECLRDNSWLDSTSLQERSSPCAGTEVRAKCLHDTYKGFEPTQLRQCVMMAEAVPTNHPLLFAQNVPSVTRVRQLLPTLQKSIGRMERKHHRLPTSPAYLAQCTIFRVSSSDAVMAIDYVDGDGGFLVAELVPGLTDYLDSQGGLATLERFADGNNTLVSFREFGHDAIELSHVYRRADCHRTKNLGVESLRLARRLIAECDSLFVCTRGQLDGYGKRLIVEVVTGKDGALTSNAQEQLTAGLSVPLGDAPVAYLECAAKAEANGAGIFSIFPVTVAKSLDMSPSRLRQLFRDGTTNQFAVREGEAVCKVSARSDWRNDSHMTLYGSTLPRAGCGLFGRCQPPERLWEEGQAASSPVVIRKNDQVCLYAKHPLTTPVEQLSTADYVVAVEAFGRSRLYDASTYDGSNIGRFANDAGLLPGLKAMVRLSNKLCYPTGCDWRVVEETARQYCNAAFKSKGPTAVVLVATRDITLGRRSQEIFVSYGIQGYWVPCIASKIIEWGIDSEMVQALLWCVTSEQSNWPPNLRSQCLADMRRVYPDIDNHCDVSCPWPELLGSTLPPRRARSGWRP